MVTSAEDLALRNEQQAAYQQKRAARRGEDGDDGSESDEEDLPEFDAEAAEAMRAARENTGEKTQKKKSTTEGLIKTANPNAPQKQHLKMSQLDGSAPKPELTRREREELDRQRRAAAYAKKHASGQTDEAKADLERLRAAGAAGARPSGSGGCARVRSKRRQRILRSGDRLGPDGQLDARRCG